MLANKIKKIISPLYAPLFAISIALLFGAVVIMIAGENPIEVYQIMLKGAFGSQYYTFTTLTRATPIIITGLGAAIAWKSSYMGIGGEGQMIWGGFIAAITALYFPGGIVVKAIAAVIFATLFGGMYSAMTGWLLHKFDVSLAISTLMLNYIAQYVTWHYVANVYLDKSGDMKMTQTVAIDKELQLPKIVDGYSLHIGFIFAVILVFVVWFFMNKTTLGYEIRMTGFNMDFCNYGGVNSKKTMYLVLFISGAICALAGVFEVFGTQYKYIHNSYVSTQYAWVGLNAALISNYNPIGVLITSIILAGIQTGGSAIARSTSIPLEISSVIQGCVTLFISAKIVINFAKLKSKEKKEDK